MPEVPTTITVILIWERLRTRGTSVPCDYVGRVGQSRDASAQRALRGHVATGKFVPPHPLPPPIPPPELKRRGESQEHSTSITTSSSSSSNSSSTNSTSSTTTTTSLPPPPPPSAMAWCVVGRGVSILYLLFQRTQTQSSPEVPTPGKCRRRKCGNAAPSVSVLARVLGGPAESTEFVYRRGYQKSGDKSRISKRHAEATRCVNLRKRGPPPPSSSSSSSSSYLRIKHGVNGALRTESVNVVRQPVLLDCPARGYTLF
ncbi:hypothetical protein PV326_010814 [Microctonus aethiopoides]|nr:hypothetical protein PV326_010814 [Microctonus aethiopoides]